MTIADDPFAPSARRAGRRGARESHEPRLDIRLFPESALAADAWVEWDGTNGVTNWGMDGNGPNVPGPGPQDPAAFPQGMGNCGYAAPDHGNAAKANNLALVGTLGAPAFPVPFGAYWAYGVSQGETGTPPAQPDQPDQGVDNRSWLGFLYKAGVIKGYAEVPVDQIGHYAPAGHGLLIGQNLPDSAESDFEAVPPIPWGSPGEVPDNQEGHDTWLIVTHADRSGELITWGGNQPFTPSYPAAFITDAWMVWTSDDPTDISPELQAALDALHGVVSLSPNPQPLPEPDPNPPVPVDPPPVPVEPPTPAPPEPGPTPDGFIAELESLAHDAIDAIVSLVERAGGSVPEWTGERAHPFAHDIAEFTDAEWHEVE